MFADNNTIKFRPNTKTGVKKGGRWYAVNILAELDSAGEYYIDRAAGVLYLWPTAPLTPANDGVSGVFASSLQHVRVF